MLARVQAAAVHGIEALPVTVEVDVSGGLPGLTMVGLPDATVRESRERVRAAIRNSGFDFPSSRITVSLAPADLRKVGTAFDLPIAIGVLAAAGAIPAREVPNLTVVGGLGLDGGILPLRGLLPIAVSVRDRSAGGLMCPATNAGEAAVVEGLDLHPVTTLANAVHVASQEHPEPVMVSRASSPADATGRADLSEIRGQALARRALEVAAAGGHHLLFSGPPGAGKTMLARRLPGVLPSLSFDEALTVTTIHSVAGLLPAGAGLMSERPFRAPHHTCSDVALIGGGSVPRPGELSLAHGGVLFLDELPEFSRRVLETLRQPLEEGVVRIARAAHTATFPAAPMLVAAMNPCPCGFQGLPRRTCRCPPGAIERYARRLSGPLRDRFDLAVDVGMVAWDDVRRTDPGESSAAVRARVVAARSRQLAERGRLNSALSGDDLRRVARPADRAADLVLREGASKLQLSVRAVTRVLRVARTIGDLATSDGPPAGGRASQRAPDFVTADHLVEALQYRLPGQMT